MIVDAAHLAFEYHQARESRDRLTLGQTMAAATLDWIKQAG
jgi:hypothetical protein